MQGHLNAIRTNQLDYLQTLSLEDWNSIQNEWKIPAGHMMIMEKDTWAHSSDGDDKDEGVMKMIELMSSKGYELTATANIVWHLCISIQKTTVYLLFISQARCFMSSSTSTICRL